MMMSCIAVPPTIRAIAGSALLAIAIVVASVGPAFAQEGAVEGRVTDARTELPLVNAQIVLPGTSVGTLTGADGTFAVRDLRPGEYSVEARSLGYRTTRQTVQIEEGETVEVAFDLAATAVPLDEVVVTGQPGAVARREIGNAVITIDAEALETAPVTTLSQLLQSRAPGVAVLPGGGKSGQGSRIVMRGVGSLAQTVQPLIYVDGVRIDNSVHTGIDVGGASWAGFEDINPTDIDRIEIVRGASAATLYGTEASAGVIQIFTKRGRGGVQNWNLRSELGVNQTPREWWGDAPGSDWFYDNVVETGRQHTQQLSVRGATDRFSYYASGTVRGDQGVLPQSDADLASFRSNLNITPAQNLSIGISTGYSRRNVQMPYDGGSPFGLGLNALAGGEEGVNVAPSELDLVEPSFEAGRFVGGARVEHTILSNLSHSLGVGVDVLDTNNDDLVQWGSAVSADSAGRRMNVRRGARTVNVEYAANLRADLTPTIRSKTAAGFQGYHRDMVVTFGSGQTFAGPGLITIGSTAGGQTGSETRVEARSAGFFLEEQLGFDDRFFVTLGARLDGHSAFGRDHLQLYPKAHTSYVLSEHDFWPESLGTLRLRGAYGAAGQQPGAFIATRTWQAVRGGGGPSFTTGTIGDPNMGPEVSHEFEAGLDAGLLNDRLTLELTFYNQRTAGALFPVRHPPSSGFVQTQLENVAEVANRGAEVAIGASLVDRPGFRWNVRAMGWTNSNEVVDLGEQVPVNLTGLQWNREGHPVASFYDEDDTFLGAPHPTRSLQFGTDVGLGDNLSLNLLADHRGGHHLESNTLRTLDELGTAEDESFDAPASDYIFSADFWRLREVGISYAIPTGGIGAVPLATGATVYAAGRNLWRSQSYPGLEAEANFDALQELGSQTFFDTPLPRQIVAGVSIQF